MKLKQLGFTPIPALVVLIATLHVSVDPSLFYDPGWLIPATNTVFVTGIGLAVAYMAMRNFKANGRIQVLLLGCGVLAFGLGGMVAGVARRVPGTGANLNVTIYNTAALAGALFHAVAAFLLVSGATTEARAGRRRFWLTASYGGTAALTVLFSLASLRGMIPPFFIQGVGPTPLRQAILGSADILFAFSFVVFLATYLRNREVFLYWYSLALALTSISLTAFFIQHSVGSPVGWAGRFSQYLGGVYFLVALDTAIRAAQARNTSFDNIITASLSPAEEKFRALAENSPDAIARFDRELRLVYVNPAGLKLLGKRAADVIGKTIAATGMAEPHGGRWQDRIRKVLESGRPLEVDDDIPGANGPRFYRSRYVPEYGTDASVANVLVVSADITGRKRAEESLRYRNVTLDGINRIFREAMARSGEREFGRACLAIAEEVTRSRIGFVGEIGPDGLVHDIAISDPGWELCRMHDRAGHRRPPGNFGIRGLYGRVILDGKGFFTNDPASHPDGVGTPEGHPQLTAFIGAPLIHGGRTIGVLALANRQGGYRVEDLDVVQALAGAIVQALLHTRAAETLGRSEERYRELFVNMQEGYAYCRMIFDDGDPPDFVYLSVNEAFGILTGLKGVEGRRVSEVIPGLRESDPGVLEMLGRVALSGKAERFETFVAALQEWFSVAAYCPEPGHFIAVFDTITERKLREELVNRNLRRFGLLAAAAGVLLRTLEPQQAVEAVCRDVMEHLDCHVFFNFLADEKAGKLRLNAWAGIPA